MIDLHDLIERLQDAEGPDRDIDAELDAMLRIGTAKMPAWTWANFPTWRAAKLGMVEVVHDSGAGGMWWDSLPFTRSVEAATILTERMLPEWGRTSYWNNCQGHMARVEDDANFHTGSTGAWFEGFGRTAGIALCIATLKAIEARPDLVKSP